MWLWWRTSRGPALAPGDPMAYSLPVMADGKKAGMLTVSRTVSSGEIMEIAKTVRSRDRD
jgi:hypothetical protein